jgi:hypothetical protein
MKALGQRGRFGLSALALIAFFCAAGWFCVTPIVDAARPLAEAILQMAGIAGKLDRSDDGGWVIWTQHVIVSGPPERLGQTAGLLLGVDDFRTLLRGVPIYLALMIASRPLLRPRFGRMGLGLAILFALFVLSACATVNFQFAVLVEQRANPLVSRITPPDFKIIAPAYGDVLFALAGYGNYLALMVLPLAAPLILWAGQSQDMVRRLLGAEPRVAADPSPDAPVAP